MFESIVRLIVAVLSSALVLLISGCQPPPVARQALDESRLERVPLTRSLEFEDSELRWYPAQVLRLEGRGWEATSGPFGRLPLKARDQVPELVWESGKSTSGVVVRFVTDSEEIAIQWNGGEDFLEHPLAEAQGGVDLYVWTEGGWKSLGSAAPRSETTRIKLVPGVRPLPNPEIAGLREFMLYFPMRAETTELSVGIRPEARIFPGPERPSERRKPLVFYGTSITQGFHASRSGLGHASIISRRLDREVINLGFASLGKMEIEIADLLAELDAALYVIDCLPNMDKALVEERYGAFVRRLRELRPHTPIVLPEHPQKEELNVLVREIIEQLRVDGLSGLTVIPGHKIIRDRPDRLHLKGHPTDKGFRDMVKVFEKTIRRLLEINP